MPELTYSVGELEDKLDPEYNSDILIDLIFKIHQHGMKTQKIYGGFPNEDDKKWASYIKNGKWIDLKKMEEYDKELNTYFERTGIVDFESEMEKQILTKIKEYLLKEEE